MSQFLERRSGAVVISVWLEQPAKWRARITGVLDVRSPKREEVVVDSNEAVCEVLGEWLTAFQEQRDAVGWNRRAGEVES